MNFKYILVLIIVLKSLIVFGEPIPERNPFVAATDLTINADGTLSLDFSEIKVRDLLQMLAKHAGLNVIINNAVQDNLALHLDHVTWSQAIDTIVAMENLTKKQQGNILFIGPNSSEKSKLMVASKLIKLRYAKAVDIAALLKSPNNNLLTKEGGVAADPRTNVLLIRDIPERLPSIVNVITRLDVPVKQVLIKARIVNVDEKCLNELGIKFGTVNTLSGNGLGGLTMDIPISMNSTGRFNIAVAKLGPNTLLDLELSALESEGRGKIISSPELLTADRMPAYIESGEEVPYQEKAGEGTTSVAFKKAVLSLKVTPQIAPDGKIILDLVVNHDRLSTVSVQGVPAIQTREVQTQVAVNDSQTLVLGGIYEQSNSHAVERIPFLGSIPGVGHLFSNQTTQAERKELLIFVTPKVVE